MPQYFPKFHAKTTRPINSYSLFENRRWYKEKTTEIYNNFNNNYIDLWYDVPYYGKVNRNGILMAPSKASLIYSMNHNLTTLNFVTQAFNDFVFFMKRGAAQGKTSLRTLFSDFKVKKSFYDSQSQYLNFAFSFMHAYNDYIVNNGKVVYNMETYVCEWLNFFKIQQTLFSYYSIFAGKFTPVNATGLAIEFFTDNHDSDFSKNRIYQNPEFYKFVQTAANFGFRINKNAPWMLIADLNSAPMRTGRRIKRSGKITKVDGYMEQDFIPTLDYLFEQYYDRVSLSALSFLESAMIYGYKEYQSKRYIIRDEKIIYEIDADEKLISFGNPVRDPSRLIPIDSYKSSLSKNPASLAVEEADLRRIFDSHFYLKLFEKILKEEYKTDNDKNYRIFKNKFDQKNNSNHSIREILDVLESFYSSTKIFDPTTNKPFWVSPKKDLTNLNQHGMIPDEKEKPTVSRIVTEFYTGY